MYMYIYIYIHIYSLRPRSRVRQPSTLEQNMEGRGSSTQKWCGLESNTLTPNPSHLADFDLTALVVTAIAMCSKCNNHSVKSNS